MENALELKTQPEEIKITPNDVRKFICAKATDKEIELFLITCKLHGLNPLKREAYLIKYGNEPAQTVVGYETYLKRAESTGLLNGWECDADDEKAWITIYRKDRQFPFKWSIERSEFDKGVAMWKKMPRHMLKKTVCSIGFRLCFPETLGGMPYTREEMEGAEVIEYSEIPPESQNKAPDKPVEPRSQKSKATTPAKKKEPEINPQDEVFYRESLLNELPGLIDMSEYDRANMKKPLEEMTTKQLEQFKAHVLTLIPEDMMEDK